MQFKITLYSRFRAEIPINYQYPLSGAIYRIIEKGDAEYSKFLHETGYGKGYKFFTFSDLKCPFIIEKDRLRLLKNELEFIISFHLPQASQHFIQGLFQSQEIVIADQKSKAVFEVKSVETLPDPFREYHDLENVSVTLKPLSMIVAGVKNEKGNYDYLAPDHFRFKESLLFNWRKKIEANYGAETAEAAFVSLQIHHYRNPSKSRLIKIKSGTPSETKIRGFNNFLLEARAEKRFLQVLVNCGAGLETAMGCGCVNVEEVKKPKNEPV